jgi:hypothetical protein
MRERISERRAAARFSLSLSATIYDGQAETHCQIKDLSRLGVAVTALSEAPPNRVLRVVFPLRETGLSVLGDCIPVRNSSRPGNAWALRFLSPHGDLPANLENHLAQSGTRELKRAAASVRRHTSHTTPGPGGKNRAPSNGARNQDLNEKLGDLYRMALESLDPV